MSLLQSEFITVLSDEVSVMDISEIGGDSNGPIFIDQLFCSGLETSVFDCDYNTVHMCTHQQDIGIICQRKRIIVFMIVNKTKFEIQKNHW